MRSFLIAIALLFSLPAAGADDHQELRALLDEFLVGASVNDAAVHDRFWAEDLVYTSSGAERFGKAEIMAGLADADTPAEQPAATPSYSAQDVNVRTYGATAVITFRLVAKQDGDMQAEYFNTGVFHKREGIWRAVAWQATRIGAENGQVR